MREVMTKSMARNIFFGGSVFFIVIFVALSVHSHRYIVTRSTNAETLTESVVLGKHVWEKHACINCHTILGEGAYFAPELGNVYKRFGNSKEAIIAFIKSRPAEGIPGRRSMPQFNLSDEELDAVAEFLKYTSEINAAGWPPNIQG